MVALRILPCIFVLSSLLQFCTSESACITSHNRKCRRDLREIYHDELAPGRVDFRCCHESEHAKHEESSAGDCFSADCVSINAGGQDMCSRNRTIKVSDTTVTFVEAVRDECELSTGGTGVMALCCPKDSLELRLTTLLGAELHEFPHFARIEQDAGNMVNICGGTIYNERFIITASHCVVENTEVVSEDKITAVLDVLIRGKSTQNKYSVAKIHVHPNSTKLSKKKQPLKNDIAILELSNDIEFSDHIQALPLAPLEFEAGKYDDTAIIVGFGDTDTLTTSKKLQKADAIIRDATDSTKKGSEFARQRPHKDQLLFLGGFVDGKASPSGSGGDSGGPAVCRNSTGMAVLCGLTSKGANNKEKCEASLSEDECHPTIYVRVDYFRKWIEEVAGNQNGKKVKVMQKYLYGKDVKPEDYTHQVEIIGGDHKCGGTMLSKDVLITAAHCVANDNGKLNTAVQVFRGMNGKNSTFNIKSIKVMDGYKKIGGPGNKRLVKRIAVFAANATWDYPYYKNDLALVKLEKEVRGLTGKLPTLSTAVATGNATELAWTTSPKRNGALAERKFKMITNHECQIRMDKLSHNGQSYTVDSNLVCGVEDYSGGSRCDRSTGGGLFCGDKVLCGVQTFRLCEFAVPNAFMDIALNGEWIEKAMKGF